MKFSHIFLIVFNLFLVLGNIEADSNFQIDSKSNFNNLSFLVENLSNKNFPINGYFSHYGQGAFDWLYVSAISMNIYKLDGMDENGYLKWTPLSKYFDEVQVTGKIIHIGKKKDVLHSSQGSETGNSNSSTSEEIFFEPGLERCIRKTLNISNTQAITKDMLLNITSLTCYNSQIVTCNVKIHHRRKMKMYHP
ncbi:hypothetical protein [Nitratiruptor tergarcus]|uniref:Uncharacterized protein n=1 Tax=Nitratiruptor tergarcus DSM 16512 TaxID=1069081 RepID=A0A1W1WV37_9BACT|nr:hypothetical protein [Nitratiruptor tergarcus]SMC10049.1 hypothetical protein SAMN05660197_1880 [Nitratiruptor tergarcus DSM 16512]